jgi:hypothetical protein
MPNKATDTPKAVFLSHSSADKELANQLCALLEERGFSCWIDSRDLILGQPYGSGCGEGVAASRSLLLLASEHALASVQVLSEVEQAHKRAKPIYTLLIPPAKVRGEMDFYISRLHWIETAGRTPDEIAQMLASVMSQQSNWEDVASPPTLRRTMQYRPMAFVRLLAAVVLALVIVLSGVAFAVSRALSQNYLSLGYTALTVEPVDDGRAMTGHLQVFLMAKEVPFRDVHLVTASETTSGVVQQQDSRSWAIPDQVGSEQDMDIPLAVGIQRLTTCLIVPRPGLRAPYRVTQQFTLVPQSSGIRVSETAAQRVTRQDGSPCGEHP